MERIKGSRIMYFSPASFLLLHMIQCSRSAVSEVCGVQLEKKNKRKIWSQWGFFSLIFLPPSPCESVCSLCVSTERNLWKCILKKKKGISNHVFFLYFLFPPFPPFSVLFFLPALPLRVRHEPQTAASAVVPKLGVGDPGGIHGQKGEIRPT